MLMNYHELTMNEPRDSPARRKQFLVICTVMGGFLGHTLLTSGAMTSLDIRMAEFPGGEYVHKFTRRDYAASMGMIRSISSDLSLREDSVEDILYCVYLDDPNGLDGRSQRFAAGLVVPTGGDDDNDNTRREQKGILISKNEIIKAPTEAEIDELPAIELFERLPYRSTKLPKVNAAVVQFPFTNGFVSALILSHKVIPTLRKYAEEHSEKGSAVVVISTCSVKQSMCTHYAPLENGNHFLLGEKESSEHIKEVGSARLIDKKRLDVAAKKILPFYERLTTSDKASDPPVNDPVSIQVKDHVGDTARDTLSNQGSDQVSDQVGDVGSSDPESKSYTESHNAANDQGVSNSESDEASSDAESDKIGGAESERVSNTASDHIPGEVADQGRNGKTDQATDQVNDQVIHQTKDEL